MNVEVQLGEREDHVRQDEAGRRGVRLADTVGVSYLVFCIESELPESLLIYRWFAFLQEGANPAFQVGDSAVAIEEGFRHLPHACTTIAVVLPELEGCVFGDIDDLEELAIVCFYDSAISVSKDDHEVDVAVGAIVAPSPGAKQNDP
jgi:hypothetical protein